MFSNSHTNTIKRTKLREYRENFHFGDVFERENIIFLNDASMRFSFKGNVHTILIIQLEFATTKICENLARDDDDDKNFLRSNDVIKY